MLGCRSNYMILVVISCCKFAVTYAEYNLHLLHVNDIHSRFEQSDKYSGRCTQEKEGIVIICKKGFEFDFDKQSKLELFA